MNANPYSDHDMNVWKEGYEAGKRAIVPIIHGPGEYRTRGGWKATWKQDDERGPLLSHGRGKGHWNHSALTGKLIYPQNLSKSSNPPAVDWDILGPWLPEAEKSSTVQPDETPFKITRPGQRCLRADGGEATVLAQDPYADDIGRGRWIVAFKGEGVSRSNEDGTYAGHPSHPKQSSTHIANMRLISLWREPRTAEVSVTVERSGDKVRISTKIVGNKDHGTKGLCIAAAENDFDFSSIWGSVTLTGTITENQNNGETK